MARYTPEIRVKIFAQKYFNNYMKNIAKKKLFPVFMSIDCFPYAVAHFIFYSWHKNLNRFSMLWFIPLYVLWLIDFARAISKKINWVAAYGKLFIILPVKTGNNIFWLFFSYNYLNIYYANTFSLISGVYLATWRGNW